MTNLLKSPVNDPALLDAAIDGVVDLIGWDKYDALICSGCGIVYFAEDNGVSYVVVKAGGEMDLESFVFKINADNSLSYAGGELSEAMLINFLKN